MILEHFNFKGKVTFEPHESSSCYSYWTEIARTERAKLLKEKAGEDIFRTMIGLELLSSLYGKWPSQW